MLSSKNLRILITGGTGSLGKVLVGQWAGDGHEVTVVSLDIHKQDRLMANLPGVALHSIDLGDNDNLPRLERICLDNDVCVHAAAKKIVSMGGYQPSAYISTNIQGTENLINAWAAAHGDCQELLAVSTDKACAALNFYGATKKVVEGLVREMDGSVLRYGNVVTSRGSFIQVWKDAIRRGRPVTLRAGVTMDGELTGEFPTRFFLSMDQAVGLVEEAVDLILDGKSGIWVPDGLWAFSMKDVADEVARPPAGHGYEVAPIEGYEKLHERLLVPGEGWQGTGRHLGRVVVPHWPTDGSYYDSFKSDTARRLAGRRVLELAGWWE